MACAEDSLLLPQRSKEWFATRVAGQMLQEKGVFLQSAWPWSQMVPALVITGRTRPELGRDLARRFLGGHTAQPVVK